MTTKVGGWARLNPGAWDSFWGVHVGTKARVLGCFLLLSHLHTQEAGLGMAQPEPVSVGDAIVPQCQLPGLFSLVHMSEAIAKSCQNLKASKQQLHKIQIINKVE